MTNFLIQNRKTLNQNHYIQLSQAHPLYWTSFTVPKVAKLKRNFEDQFCLVVTRDHFENDCFVFPYWEVKDYFSEDRIHNGKSWKIYIKANEVWFEGHQRGVFNASRYYNALNFLAIETAETSFGEELSLSLDDNNNQLRTAISYYNEKYREVAPTTKISLSKSIERPGLISDNIKRICDYRCQICGVEGFVQRNGIRYAEAHHLIELHELIPSSYCSDNIIVVCPTCHRKLHYATVTIVADSRSTIEVIVNGERYRINRNVISE